MNDKPTHASVTSEPCKCGYLQESASDSTSPIIFDDKTGEFQFSFIGKGLDGPSILIIYHCPFCGGAAPESKRALLFEVISNEEEARLAEILRPIQTVDDALKVLGKPDFDDFEISRMPEQDGNPPKTHHCRMLRYTEMSDVAFVEITERLDGKVYWGLQGKPVAR